jgi:hypothetical protein
VSARFKPFKMADDLQRKAYLFQLNQAQKLSDESLMADADYDSQKEDDIMQRESARRAESAKKAQLHNAEIQGEAQMIQGKWQNKVQRQQMIEQMAMQNEMQKDQIAFQGQQQSHMMQQQMAQQQGQPAPEPPPGQQPQPRQPQLITPPQEIQSPLTAKSVQSIPQGSTGDTMIGRQNVDIMLLGRQLADKIGGLPPPTRVQAMAQLKAQQPELHDVVLGLMGGGGPSRASTASARPLPEQKPARRGPEAQLI